MHISNTFSTANTAYGSNAANTIFTDGASSGNPGPGGWGAIISYGDKVAEIGGGETRTTNNRMELNAVIKALEYLIEQEQNKTQAVVFSDSSYVVNGVTSWIHGWKKRDWKNGAGDTIANVDLWKSMGDLMDKIQFRMVSISGHSGIPGNERADEIATEFIKTDSVPLYYGIHSEYPFDLENIKVNPEQKQKKDSKGKKAFSYLSLIDGDLQIHTTWADCKQRVDGVKGKVRYKKAISKEDQEDIIRSWGL